MLKGAFVGLLWQLLHDPHISYCLGLQQPLL